MKIRIVKCSFSALWYSDKIGCIYQVEHSPDYPDQWQITHIGEGVLKSDCEIVEETGSFEVSGECFPRGAKKMVAPEQVSDEERGCKTCRWEKVCTEAQKIECMCDKNWRPKEAKEKPKKLKYVCTACVGTKCIKKTIGVLPTNCKYPQANWKLKEVK